MQLPDSSKLVTQFTKPLFSRFNDAVSVATYEVLGFRCSIVNIQQQQLELEPNHKILCVIPHAMIGLTKQVRCSRFQIQTQDLAVPSSETHRFQILDLGSRFQRVESRFVAFALRAHLKNATERELHFGGKLRYIWTYSHSNIPPVCLFINSWHVNTNLSLQSKSWRLRFSEFTEVLIWFRHSDIYSTFREMTMRKFERVVLSLLLASLTLDISANTAPIAISDLVVVDSSESLVIRLKGYDKTVKNVGTTLIFTLHCIPGGSLLLFSR